MKNIGIGTNCTQYGGVCSAKVWEMRRSWYVKRAIPTVTRQTENNLDQP